MQVTTTKKWLMTTSSDGCVIIVSEDKKTEQTDFFISEDCLAQNIKNVMFTKHKTMVHNDKPVYVLTSDLQKFL
tara:strand:+ start:210 stop:431 length:222 start_codon:yes stop_codon:yes gene_type:complete